MRRKYKMHDPNDAVFEHELKHWLYSRAIMTIAKKKRPVNVEIIDQWKYVGYELQARTSMAYQELK